MIFDTMKCTMLLILLSVLLLWPAYGLSQETVLTKSKKAIEAYNNGLKKFTLHDYKAAEGFFLSAIEADTKFMDAYLMLGEVYENSNQPLKAIDAYQTGLKIKEDYYPFGYIRLGKLQYREGQYENAKSSYSRYLSFKTYIDKYKEDASVGIVRCEFSIEAMKNPVDFEPVSLGPAINTTYDEYWPSLSADEQTLVITRLVPSRDLAKKIQEDFFISHWSDGSWGEMKNAGRPLNTEDNEGAQTLSGDGRMMVFTGCNRVDAVGRCDLYYSIKEGDNWTPPRNIGRQINTAYRETQPSITPDGRTLYFSSDRPGGMGKHDIWVSHLNDNNLWMVPENIGAEINTPGIEMSPFIHPDNQSLYFSSDGQIGLGGYDLFVSRRDSTGKWQKPLNLGYPINTNRDEIGLVVNSRGDKAYYSSDVNKTNGKDIFVFDLPVQSRPVMTTYMKGNVFDAEDKQLLRAQFELVNLETGTSTYRSYSDSLTGEFLVSIPVNSNYMLNVSRNGYLFFSENFTLKDTYRADKPYLKDVPLQPLKTGNRIVLKNVFYETDSYALKKESAVELNKVVRLLQTNPNIRIEISGHTDNTGNLDYNRKLSENRARSVADFLISASVKAERIVAKGYGMSRPVASNDTDEGRAQNRRTELQIIEQ